ncbi:hypothetical protein MG293_000493 [Ovis ammon polii]|uniref:Uncharacterized protein n=1 Tax=Ovis ammon polii TaxID=230172 RepID=A0AAD4UJ76_OVIAM|nr:hypothetical protein MG293_000493 [Ovis ammon polii]
MNSVSYSSPHNIRLLFQCGKRLFLYPEVLLLMKSEVHDNERKSIIKQIQKRIYMSDNYATSAIITATTQDVDKPTPENSQIWKCLLEIKIIHCGSSRDIGSEEKKTPVPQDTSQEAPANTVKTIEAFGILVEKDCPLSEQTNQMQRGVKSHNQFMCPLIPVYEYVYQILSKKAYFDEKEKKVSSGLGILGTHYQTIPSGDSCLLFNMVLITKEREGEEGIEELKDGSEDKASVCNAGDPGLIPGSGRSPLEKEMAPHSSTTAWKMARTEEPGTYHFNLQEKCTALFHCQAKPEVETHRGCKIKMAVYKHKELSLSGHILRNI